MAPRELRIVSGRPRLVAVAVVAMLCSVAPSLARAQGPRIILPESVAPSWSQPAAPSVNLAAAGIIGSGAKDHRYTGMYVGLGTWALYWTLGLIACQGTEGGCNTDNLGFRLVGSAALLGGVGAMIGRAFSKHPPPTTAGPSVD